MTLVAADTSFAVALVMASHRDHDAVASVASAWSVRLPAHAHLETFSVLTRLPGDARLTGADAATLIADRFGPPLEPSDVRSATLLTTLADAGVVGGAVYDGLIGLTAHDAGLVLVTRDRRAVPTLLALGVEHELMTG